MATAQNLGTRLDPTIESKTNFLAAGRAGTEITGDCTPLHRGRRTMVWQTRVSGPDGKLLALVTQTQAVLERTRPPAEIMAGLFAGKSALEQEALLASLERAGGALWPPRRREPRRRRATSCCPRPLVLHGSWP